MGTGKSVGRGRVAPTISRPRHRTFGARKIPGQRSLQPPPPGPVNQGSRTGPGPGRGPSPPKSK